MVVLVEKEGEEGENHRDLVKVPSSSFDSLDRWALGLPP
jgi:hypothetical protein